MGYHWTESADEIAQLAAIADAVELAGCIDDGQSTERVDAGAADFFSVYLHFPAEWQGDPNELQGAMCIADRDTFAEARAFADEIAGRYGFPVNVFADPEG